MNVNHNYAGQGRRKQFHQTPRVSFEILNAKVFIEHLSKFQNQVEIELKSK